MMPLAMVNKGEEQLIKKVGGKGIYLETHDQNVSASGYHHSDHGHL